MGKMADALKWFKDAVFGAKVQNEREDLLEALYENNLAHAENHIERQSIEQRNREIRKRLGELAGANRRVERPLVDQFAERHPAMAERLRNPEPPHLAEVRPIRAKESA